MERMPERKEYLDFSELGSEVMVFDPQTEVAYCLNALAGQVLQACDGKTLKADVIRALNASEQASDLLEFTLTELNEQGLLKEKVRHGLSRRSFLTKWGAAAAMLPIIASIQAPQEAHAQSGSTTSGFTTTLLPA